MTFETEGNEKWYGKIQSFRPANMLKLFQHMSKTSWHEMLFIWRISLKQWKIMMTYASIAFLLPLGVEISKIIP